MTTTEENRMTDQPSSATTPRLGAGGVPVHPETSPVMPSSVAVERSAAVSGARVYPEPQNGADGRERVYSPGCGCAWCGDLQREIAKDAGDWVGSLRSVMHICGTCGNKRCPHASAHWQDCTRSNDSGQVGSYYGVSAPQPARADEIATVKATS